MKNNIQFLLVVSLFMIQSFNGYTQQAKETSTISTVSDPVKESLLAFNADARRSSIICEWTMEGAVKSKSYEVQRSSNNEEFKTIGRVEGNDESETLHLFKFKDKEVVPNVLYYYRLHLLTDEFSSAYSAVVPAILKEQGYAVVEAYPNPYRESTTIQYLLTRAAMVTIEVTDVQGKMVKRYQQGLQDAGPYTLPFSARNNGLTPGNYIVSIWCDDQHYQLRLTELN